MTCHTEGSWRMTATTRSSSRRYEGSPEITEWCETCECRSLYRDYGGTCLWCDRRIKFPLSTKRTRPPHTDSERAVLAALEVKPRSTPYLLQALDYSKTSVYRALRSLSRSGAITTDGPRYQIPVDGAGQSTQNAGDPGSPAKKDRCNQGQSTEKPGRRWNGPGHGTDGRDPMMQRDRIAAGSSAP